MAAVSVFSHIPCHLSPASRPVQLHACTLIALMLQASVSLLAILQRTSFLPDGLTPDPGLDHSVNASDAAQYPDPASGESSPDSPLLAGIMRIDGEAPQDTQPVSQSNGVSRRVAKPRREVLMRSLENGVPRYDASGNGVSSSEAQPSHSNGAGRTSAPELAGRSATAAEARSTPAGMSSSSSREAVAQELASQEMQPDSIAEARQAAEKGPAKAEDEARAKADARAQQVVTVRQARALRGDAQQAKWAAPDKEFDEATQWLALLRSELAA